MPCGTSDMLLGNCCGTSATKISQDTKSDSIQKYGFPAFLPCDSTNLAGIYVTNSAWEGDPQSWAVDDIARYINGATTTYYKCKQAVAAYSSNPATDTIHFETTTTQTTWKDTYYVSGWRGGVDDFVQSDTVLRCTFADGETQPGLFFVSNTTINNSGDPSTTVGWRLMLEGVTGQNYYPQYNLNKWVVDRNGIYPLYILKGEICGVVDGDSDPVYYRCKVSFNPNGTQGNPTTDTTRWESYSGTETGNIIYRVDWTRPIKFTPNIVYSGQFVSSVGYRVNYVWACNSDCYIGTLSEADAKEIIFYQGFYNGTAYDYRYHEYFEFIKGFSLLPGFLGEHNFLFNRAAPVISTFTNDGVTVTKCAGPIRYKRMIEKTIVRLNGESYSREVQHDVDLPTYDNGVTGYGLTSTIPDDWPVLAFDDIPADYEGSATEDAIRRIKCIPNFRYYQAPAAPQVMNVWKNTGTAANPKEWTATATAQVILYDVTDAHYLSIPANQVILGEYTFNHSTNKAKRKDNNKHGLPLNTTTYLYIKRTVALPSSFPKGEHVTAYLTDYYKGRITLSTTSNEYEFYLVNDNGSMFTHASDFDFFGWITTEVGHAYVSSYPLSASSQIIFPVSSSSGNCSIIRPETVNQRNWDENPFEQVSGTDHTYIQKALVFPYVAKYGQLPSGLDRKLYVANRTAFNEFYLTDIFSETKVVWGSDAVMFAWLNDPGGIFASFAAVTTYEIEHNYQLANEFTDTDFITLCGQIGQAKFTPACGSALKFTAPLTFHPLPVQSIADYFIGPNCSTAQITPKRGRLCYEYTAGCVKLVKEGSITCDDWTSSALEQLDLDCNHTEYVAYKANVSCSC